MMILFYLHCDLFWFEFGQGIYTLQMAFGIIL